jgi:hypothetical protein
MNDLKGWVLEGSKERNSWSEIGRQEGCGNLNTQFAVKTFSVVRSDEVGPLRLRQAGLNHH